MGINFFDIKKQLYFTKLNILFNKALKNGKITRFEENIFDKMNDTIIACLPVSLYVKYSNYLFPEGSCIDRSLYMFLALDDAVLVRGDMKDLEYKYGEGHEEHGWVEIGDYVYDPSSMLKFDKDIYYKLYDCTNVRKTDKETYLEQNKEFVNTHVTHDYDEFKPYGKRRHELGILIFQIMSLSKMLGDEQFTNDINDYLTTIQYDEEKIDLEREEVIQKMISNEALMSIVSGNKR